MATRLGCFSGLLLLLAGSAAAQDWYRSNASGMALERLPSELAALHAGWALSVEAVSGPAPALLAPWYDPAFTVERRVLYERGTPRRCQWLFRDGRDITRINASLPAAGAVPAAVKEPAVKEPAVFVEVFSKDGSLEETQIFEAAGKIRTVSYEYNDGVLIRAKENFDGKLQWTDRYRYTRSLTLRGVERRYEATEEGQSPSPVLTRFPPEFDSFISPGSPYEHSLMSGALRDVFSVPAVTVLYTTDSRGRVTLESHLDDEGKVRAELANEWSGGQITVITWKAGENRGRIEFDYASDGDRIAERDYRNGGLERIVRYSGGRDTEELYVNGQAVLRAVWEGGRKISEERIK